MILTLKRQVFSDRSTIGVIALAEKVLCYSLEDKDRGLTSDMSIEELKSRKVHGETAIATGRYEIVLQWSEHFQKLMPFLQNVPDYTGIMIHPGNKPIDTLGCILTGTFPGEDVVGESRVAFDLLFPLIAKALGYEFSELITPSKHETNWEKKDYGEQVFIEIVRDQFTRRVTV